MLVPRNKVSAFSAVTMNIDYENVSGGVWEVRGEWTRLWECESCESAVIIHYDRDIIEREIR